MFHTIPHQLSNVGMPKTCNVALQALKIRVHSGLEVLMCLASSLQEPGGKWQEFNGQLSTTRSLNPQQ
jgi:hypothetical protein